MNAAIRTVGLTKRFGARAALAGADLQVPSGGITGLLGPNGAGKTTLLKLLLVLALVVVLPGSWFGLTVPAAPRPPISTAWDPWLLADPRLWRSGPPLHALLMSATIAAAGVTAALLRFERIEP